MTSLTQAIPVKKCFRVFRRRFVFLLISPTKLMLSKLPYFDQSAQTLTMTEPNMVIQDLYIFVGVSKWTSRHAGGGNNTNKYYSFLWDERLV